MTKLTRIHMQNNSITDITPLTEMISMLEIYADNNRISDISSLEKMKRIQWLRLSGNPVEDGTVIENFTGLKKAYIDDTLIPTDQITALREALPNAEIND
jgi:Leucine-rich repeat (LRR) protein